jgi:hypothetical protein
MKKCTLLTDRMGQLQMIATTKRTGRSDYPYYVRLKVAEGCIYSGYHTSSKDASKKIKSYASIFNLKAY